jgi:hypothetical protein
MGRAFASSEQRDTIQLQQRRALGEADRGNGEEGEAGAAEEGVAGEEGLDAGWPGGEWGPEGDEGSCDSDEEQRADDKAPAEGGAGGHARRARGWREVAPVTI